jgi:DNA-binding MarR family transcriptional regulator
MKMSDVPHSPDRKIPLLPLLDGGLEAFRGDFEGRLAEAGYGDIRPTHGCVFRFVRDEGMRLTELAAHAGMTKQATGEVVDGLVALGYAERIPDPADRRAKLIRLTERGAEAQRFGTALFARLEERWKERYGADRIEQLRETLQEIVAVERPEAVPELARPEPVGVE